jgi:hypothetical protein
VKNNDKLKYQQNAMSVFMPVAVVFLARKNTGLVVVGSLQQKSISS